MTPDERHEQIDGIETALEYLRDHLGPCVSDCDCCIHGLERSLALLLAEAPRQVEEQTEDPPYRIDRTDEEGLYQVINRHGVTFFVRGAPDTLAVPAPVTQGHTGDVPETTTDNPQSWIAWKRRAFAAEAQLRKSDAALLETRGVPQEEHEKKEHEKNEARGRTPADS